MSTWEEKETMDGPLLQKEIQKETLLRVLVMAVYLPFAKTPFLPPLWTKKYRRQMDLF